MIAQPMDWKNILGRSVTIAELAGALLHALTYSNTKVLSFSGGIDSTILLDYMVKIWGKESIECYTTVLAKLINHPDHWYARKLAYTYGVKWNLIALSEDEVIEEEGDLPGDAIVRAFYKRLTEKGVSQIIAGDGIDEYMGGYYSHGQSPTYETYMYYLNRLVPDHLTQLDRNSGMVKVYLPYLFPAMVDLYQQIPLQDRFSHSERKKVMVNWARFLGIPNSVISRHKYGFCDAGVIKKGMDGGL